MSYNRQATTSHQPVPLGYPTLPVSMLASQERLEERASLESIQQSGQLMSPFASASSQIVVNSNYIQPLIYPINFGYSYPSYYVMPVSPVHLSASLPDQPRNYSKLWAGELPSSTHEEVTDFQLCFILEKEKIGDIGLIKMDLRDLFGNSIYIQDNFSNNLEFDVIFAFMSAFVKESCLMNYAHTIDGRSDKYRFIHPKKQYELVVYLKPFSLPRDMYYQVMRSKSQGYKLYVEGINGHFTAQDLYKIYNDLYPHKVISVRIFKDRQGFPYKGAMVQFFSKESLQRAIADHRIMLKTLYLTMIVRNKEYKPLKSTNRYHGSNYVVDRARNEQVFNPSLPIQFIRDEARNESGSCQFRDIGQVYSRFTRLQHVNYLSD